MKTIVQDSVAFAQKASQSADHDNTHLRHLLASKSRFLDISSDHKGQSVRIRYCVLGAREGDSAQCALPHLIYMQQASWLL